MWRQKNLWIIGQWQQQKDCQKCCVRTNNKCKNNDKHDNNNIVTTMTNIFDLTILTTKNIGRTNNKWNEQTACRCKTKMELWRGFKDARLVCNKQAANKRQQCLTTKLLQQDTARCSIMLTMENMDCSFLKRLPFLLQVHNKSCIHMVCWYVFICVHIWTKGQYEHILKLGIWFFCQARIIISSAHLNIKIPSILLSDTRRFSKRMGNPGSRDDMFQKN